MWPEVVQTSASPSLLFAPVRMERWLFTQYTEIRGPISRLGSWIRALSFSGEALFEAEHGALVDRKLVQGFHAKKAVDDVRLSIPPSLTHMAGVSALRLPCQPCACRGLAACVQDMLDITEPTSSFFFRVVHSMV